MMIATTTRTRKKKRRKKKSEREYAPLYRFSFCDERVVSLFTNLGLKILTDCRLFMQVIRLSM